MARKPLSRWWLGGPLLAVALAMLAIAGRGAWRHHQFEKERLETPPLAVPDLKLKMIWIPAGSFTMGKEKPLSWIIAAKQKYNELKPAGWSQAPIPEVIEKETPATEVTLSQGFFLGATEVTQAQWKEVMGTEPSDFAGPNLPVETVPWDSCVEFCRRLTERERAAGRLQPGQAYRLPTEAEWEYACRAGSRGEWSCGDDERVLEDHAWFKNNSGGKTHDVATKRANAWGLFDMHGNVWEWCADGVWTYPGGSATDPLGPATQDRKVVRGGCWIPLARNCRAAFRGDYSRKAKYNGLGFRLALGAPSP